MTPIAWTYFARSEYDDALARSTDPTRFRGIVDAKLADLASGLLTGSRVPGSNCRELLTPPLPYRVVYQTEPAGHRIIAFAHNKRWLGYWKSRLRRRRP